jgi:chemotaxis protein methyltransferase CheR
VAILLAQRGLLPRVEIVASDISARALAQAARGEYGRRSLRALPPGLSEAWIRVTGDTARVSPALCSAIRWRRVNLIDAGQILALGRFDAIVCRNVFIYFSDETLDRVAGLLLNALEPDGHLLVGATESLLRFGKFVCRERGGAFFYGKVTG